jgi:rRNA maturation protein Nop10
MKINKCEEYHYTLKDVCPICKKTTKSAHYKFIKLKDVKEKSE